MSTFTFITLPAPLRTFFAHFPLYTYPAIETARKHDPSTPTIWIHPPLSSTPTGESTPTISTGDLLSADVECLKWQAYIALRDIEGVRVRWDVHEEGGIGGVLPCLWVPVALVTSAKIDEDEKRGEDVGELLPAHLIPSWVDREKGGGAEDELEGYKDIAAKDESRAWVSLLEGTVHAALMTFYPPPTSLFLMSSETRQRRSISTILTPPPAPLTGISSLLPPYGTHVPVSDLEVKYAEAMGALSERLGGARWFLDSAAPTPLDALAFAYLHTILHTRTPPSTHPSYKAHQTLRTQVTRRVNLVAWERRVSGMVRAAFSWAGEV